MRSSALILIALLFSVAGWSRDLPRYALILSDPVPLPARAQRGSAAGADAPTTVARARVLSAQESVKRELRSRGIRIIGASHVLLNAVFVEAEPSAAGGLGTINGIAHIAPMRRFHLSLDKAEQLINVPAAWNLLGGTGNAGAGVKIGIIDTGIQATHPAFQAPALTPPPGFPLCQVTYSGSTTIPPLDCTALDNAKGFPLCSTVNCQFTNNKVIVARSYVPLLSSGSADTSRPDDPSPRDRIGHGTAVAMAAAGVTNSGPSDTITGVAPGAFLGSYKVFGSPGVIDFTGEEALLLALDDAFNDGMDIVVMSLGAPSLAGPEDSGAACGLQAGEQCDYLAYTVDRAVQNGMLVVAAAGNQGQSGVLSTATLSTIDSPGDAPGAIAVAASTNSHSFGNPLTVTGLGTYDARFGDGPVPSTTFSGTLGDVASVGDPLACSPIPAGSLDGRVALVQRGTCTFAVKVQNLQAGGAAGAVITNNPGDNTLVTPSGLGGTAIPAVFLGYGDGQAIRTFLTSNPGAGVSIGASFAAFNITTYNQVAPFSSHGPSLGPGVFKPDVIAVGVDLYLAGETYDPNGELYSANGYLVSQGTSFSTPQVAGVAALVKQAYPTLSATQVKSAVVTTATQDVTENGSTASVLAVGTGKVNAGFAVQNTLIVTPSSAAFGAIQAGSLPMTQQLQLSNIGTATLNLNITPVHRTAETAAHTSIDLPNVTLAAGQTTAIHLTLTGSVPAPGIYEGFVSISGALNPVNIPYLYIVGDGVPNNLISLAGNGDDGTAGQQTAGGYVILQVIDQYGVPVPKVPVTFSVSSGGGQITALANATDNYGIAAAESILGPVPGVNTYAASAGGLSATFQAIGIAQPAILPAGVVSAANYSTQAPAPGSYVAIFGDNLAASTTSYSTPYLPLSLGKVSVSFDNPNLSVPGHVVFVSPGQVNVQIPWELQGQPSVQVKVSLGDSSGTVFTMPLGSYSPAFFELPSGGQNIAASLDESNNIVTVTNPVAHGHVVQLFLNGLGPVTNQPASGDPAPVSPLAETTATPTVTIGGLNAPAIFAGMTPGNAGLYQINATVPATSAGMQTITVAIGGVTSTVSHLPVK